MIGSITSESAMQAGPLGQMRLPVASFARKAGGGGATRLATIYAWLPILAWLAGCASGLSGQPSASDSPAQALDLAQAKAQQEARRESNAAQCSRDAVLIGVVRRLPLTASTEAAAELPRLTREQARRSLLAPDSELVPVYCRNAEPAGVVSTKPDEAKLRDAARWLDAQALVVEAAPIEAMVRALGRTRYKQYDVHDTGRTMETIVNRSGAITNNPADLSRGGHRYLTPITTTTAYLRPELGAVDVPGRYTEAWVLVRVPREAARAYRANCSPTATGAAASVERLRTCALYNPARPLSAEERSAVVPLNPEEP